VLALADRVGAELFEKAAVELSDPTILQAPVEDKMTSKVRPRSSFKTRSRL
jgi:hypothetical protein